MRRARGPRSALRQDLGHAAAASVLATTAALAVTLTDFSLFTSLALIVALLAGALGVVIARQRMAAVRAGDPPDPTTLYGRRVSTLAVVVFLLGAQTWRVRSAQELSDAPVDAAATIRIAADVLALGLVVLAMMAKGRPAFRFSLPLVWYSAYIAAVLLGVAAAVAPQLVAFRVVDLTVALLVAAEVARWHTLPQIVRLVRRVLLAFAGVILAEGAALPSLAFAPTWGGLYPARLEGVFPIMPFNMVGTIGLLLVAVALGSAEGRLLAGSVGSALVLLSQYRTGYLALAVIVVVYLIARRGVLFKVAVVATLPLGYWIYTTALFQDAWVRGEERTNSVATLSGRTEYWSLAFEVAQRSPIIGTGLTSGTRYEVLNRIGHNTTSNIHGTWIEVFLGTGVLGTVALGGVVVTSVVAAWRVREWTVAPLLLMTALLVRGLTGTTIELAHLWMVLFAIVAITVGSQPKREDGKREHTASLAPAGGLPARR